MNEESQSRRRGRVGGGGSGGDLVGGYLAFGILVLSMMRIVSGSSSSYNYNDS